VSNPRTFKSLERKYSALTWGGGKPLLKHSNLGILAMQVIAYWSEIDQLIMSMMADILELDIEIAVKMLYAVDSLTIRRQLIRTAAQHVLTPEDYEVFEATLCATRASEGRRHQFAHHIWAQAQPKPGHAAKKEFLLLMNPKSLNKKISEVKTFHAMRRLMNANHIRKIDGWWNDVLVFTEKELKEEVQEAETAHRLICWALQLLPKHPDLARRATRALLLKEPLVQKEIRHRNRQKQKGSAKSRRAPIASVPP
jgi:hypothetical protein